MIFDEPVMELCDVFKYIVKDVFENILIIII